MEVGCFLPRSIERRSQMVMATASSALANAPVDGGVSSKSEGSARAAFQ
jgi:hypothetical protein